MLIISILLGTGLLLYGLPSCLEKTHMTMTSLFGRIQLEQQANLDGSFQRRNTRWTIIAMLEKNERLLKKACEYTGVDFQKTTDILSRLCWKTTVAEVVLARGLGMVLMASSLLHLVTSVSNGHSLRMVDTWPLVASLLLYLCPTMLLDAADRRAKAEIREQVPVFFSIVQSLVEAGMPIQAAVKQTARRFDARLGRELALLEVEEKRHGHFRKALEELAFRWEVDALTAIALEINEAISKGVSIADILAVQVEEQMRQQEDEASAHMNRLNIRLLPFVILLMGVPLLFLVMGPALMGISERL